MNGNRETSLDVQGMSCPSCIRHIKEALQEVEGVSDIDVRLAQGKVVVRHEADGPPISALVGALQEAGYDSAPSKVG